MKSQETVKVTDFEERTVRNMDALGYEPVQIEGLSDDFLMWKSKAESGIQNAFGFDKWDAVNDFVDNVWFLMNVYTHKELQNRVNGEYGVIEYGTFGEREVKTALDNYSRKEELENIVSFSVTEKENNKSITENYDSDGRQKITADMAELGFVPVQDNVFPKNFLTWGRINPEKPKTTLGFDGWEKVKNFVKNVNYLFNRYTLQELQDREKGNYRKIEYGSFEDREVQAAIRCHRKLIIDGMAELGFVPVQIDGFSEDFLMWKPIGDATTDNAFGIDGWKLVENFVMNVNFLREHYTLQELQDIANGKDETSESRIWGVGEVQTAISCYQRDERLFVDMDGTLAKYKSVDTIEILFEKGYFLNLEPQQNVVDAVKKIIREHPEKQVYIMSSVLTDSKYAYQEKNEWLDKYLPEIDKEHRIFPPCGENKMEYVPGGIRKSDYLLDDYTNNLALWEPPAKGIKLLNGINHTNGTWKGNMLRYDKEPEELAQDIMQVMDGMDVRDAHPIQQQVSMANQSFEQKFKSGYISEEIKSQLHYLTKQEALAALEEGIHICCVNDYAEYHGIHADEYAISELRSAKGVKSLYSTFGTGMIHKACVSPYYDRPEEMKKLLQEKMIPDVPADKAELKTDKMEKTVRKEKVI